MLLAVVYGMNSFEIKCYGRTFKKIYIETKYEAQRYKLCLGMKNI